MSPFDKAWYLLKMTDVRVMPQMFDELGQSMNVPEIQQLIDPDPAQNMDAFNYLGDRPLGPLEGKHYAGGFDIGRGRSKGRQVNAPNYLEMNLNQPFSADTLAALRDANFTAFSRKTPDGMNYRIKGGSHMNRPPTDDERMRMTTHPAGGGPNVDLVQEIKNRQLAENIANREQGVNPNVEWREGEKERVRLEQEAYRQTPEYQQRMAAQRAKAEEAAERRRASEEAKAERQRLYNSPDAVENRRLAREAERNARLAEIQQQKEQEEAAKAEHEAMLIRRREEKQAAHEAQQKLEASPDYREKKRLEQIADRERARLRSSGGRIGVARGRRKMPFKNAKRDAEEKAKRDAEEN